MKICENLICENQSLFVKILIFPSNVSKSRAFNEMKYVYPSVTPRKRTTENLPLLPSHQEGISTTPSTIAGGDGTGIMVRRMVVKLKG